MSPAPAERVSDEGLQMRENEGRKEGEAFVLTEPWGPGLPSEAGRVSVAPVDGSRGAQRTVTLTGTVEDPRRAHDRDSFF